MKERPRRIWVSPKFYKKIRIKQIEKDYPNLIEYTDHLANDTKELEEIFKTKKLKKNERFKFDF